MAAENSFPTRTGDAATDGVTETQWEQIMQGFGYGVMQYDDVVYQRTFDDVDNTVTIHVAADTGHNWAVMNGFFHAQTEAVTLPVPPVEQFTVYHIGLAYDPQNITAPGGPIRLAVWAGTPDTTGGKKYMTLHTKERAPSTVLSTNPGEDVRPRLAPQLMFYKSTQLPDPQFLLMGTQAFCWLDASRWYVARNTDDGARWVLTSPPWTNMVLAANWEPVSAALMPQQQIVGTRVYLRGAVKTVGGTSYEPRTEGYAIGSVTTDYAPRAEVRLISAGDGLHDPGLVTVRPQTTGWIRIHPHQATQRVYLEGVYWDFE